MPGFSSRWPRGLLLGPASTRKLLDSSYWKQVHNVINPFPPTGNIYSIIGSARVKPGSIRYIMFINPLPPTRNICSIIGSAGIKQGSER